MPQHKTRKQLRQESETARAKLAVIETPEGFARLIHNAQRKDDAFKDAVSAELKRLAEAELEATGDLQQGLQDAVDVSGDDEPGVGGLAWLLDDDQGVVTDLSVSIEPHTTYRVRHVSGNVLANSLTATPNGDELTSLAAAQGVLVSDLSIEPE